MSTLTVRRADATGPDAPLVLDGDELELVSVHVEGRIAGPDTYNLTEESLTLAGFPKARCSRW